MLLMLASALSAAPQLDLSFGGQISAVRKRAVRARLVLSHEVAKPGETILAGVEITHGPGWHTYWKNPGVGIPTSIHWGLTNGITPGQIQWPVPEKMTALGNTIYGYHDTVVLLVPLKIESNAPAGSHDLAALVKWLECDPQVCVPGSNSVSATLTIGNESKPGAETNILAAAQQRLPSKELPGSAVAKWDAPPSMSVRPLVINWSVDATNPDFFPFTNATVTIADKTDVSAEPGHVLLRKSVKSREGQWPSEIAGLLVREESGKLKGYEVVLPLEGGKGAATATASPSGGPAATSSRALGVWLLYAFLGGLILNIMPCVLPVIALKILGFVNQSREHPKTVRKLGILYTLGVVASFLVLAGIVIAIKAAGQRAGWGMQFSNPPFVVGLTVIVTLVALNLFGVFEITLGGGAMGAASGAASRHGSLGAFMNGVLATLLATPCTAPFLGAALGFAFVQPSHLIVLFFVTIALGLALPYLLLSWNPAWLRFLPKPGAWMERFKVLMGFPMLATAVWLFTITETFYGNRIWWLGAFLVIVAMCAWIYGEFVQRGRTRRTTALVIVLLLLGGSFVYAVENKLQWRTRVVRAGDELKLAPKGIPWGKWSPENVAKARAEGRPVIVDFTAEWCITCNTVMKPALETDAVQARLKELNVVALLADNTSFPPEIAAELERHGRAGVPMLLIFPKDPSSPAIVVPEAAFYTTQAGHILKALEKLGNGASSTEKPAQTAAR